ncbi:ABC transporter permease [Micromonospora sp. NPDC001898]|uniref:ABC transporter permease n=1 Tax=Micromonospora sp. NPDC001898 TaxID=3364221 RepID=UPI0036AD8D55
MTPASATGIGGRPGATPTGYAESTRTTGGPAGPRPRRRGPRSAASWSRRRIGLNLLAVVAAIVVWHLAALAKNNPLVFPTPLDSARALVELVQDADSRGEVLVTLWRVVVGFALGSTLGIAVASLLGSSRVAADALEPVVHFLRSITPVAWIVPATIWFGVGDASMRFIVIYATVFPVILNTLTGMAQAARNKTRMARVFGAGRLRTYRSVVIPSAVPYVLTGMRLSLGYSFMSVIGAEMVAGSDGIGHLIYESRLFYDTPTMFAGILLVGAAGLAFDRVFVLASARIFRRFYCGQVAR